MRALVCSLVWLTGCLDFGTPLYEGAPAPTMMATPSPPDVLPPEVAPARPTLTATSPMNGAMLVDGTAPMVLTFSEPIDAASLTVQCVPAFSFPAPSFDASGKVATFAGDFVDLTSYACFVGAKSAAGLELDGEKSLTFSTRDVRPPTALSTVPADGAKGVLHEDPTVVSVRFSEPMDRSSTEAATTVRYPDDDLPISYAWSENDTVLTITYADFIADGATVTLAVSTGAHDKSENALSTPYASSHQHAYEKTMNVEATMDGRVTMSPGPTYASAAAETQTTIGGGAGDSHRSFYSFSLANLPSDTQHIVGARVDLCLTGNFPTPTLPSWGQVLLEAVTYASYPPSSNEEMYTLPSEDGGASYPCSEEWLNAAASPKRITCDVLASVRADWQNARAVSQFRQRLSTNLGALYFYKSNEPSTIGCFNQTHPRITLTIQTISP